MMKRDKCSNRDYRMVQDEEYSKEDCQKLTKKKVSSVYKKIRNVFRDQVTGFDGLKMKRDESYEVQLRSEMSMPSQRNELKNKNFKKKF